MSFLIASGLYLDGNLLDLKKSLSSLTLILLKFSSVMPMKDSFVKP